MDFIKWGKNLSLPIIFFHVLEKLNLRRTKRNSILERLKTCLEIQLVFQIVLSIFLCGNWLLFTFLPETVKSVRSMIIKYSCMGICQDNIILNAIKAFSRSASLAFSCMVIEFFLFVTIFFLMIIFLAAGGPLPQSYY